MKAAQKEHVDAVAYWRKRATRAEAEIERLREALRPFAAWARLFDGGYLGLAKEPGDVITSWNVGGADEMHITVADYRAARAALEDAK